MADTLTLNVDVASLQAVEKTLADIGAQGQEEVAELAAQPGDATDWSGGTADTLKTAMLTAMAQGSGLISNNIGQASLNVNAVDVNAVDVQQSVEYVI